VKKAIIVANWKMYIEKPEEAKRFALALKRRATVVATAEVVIAPPFTLIPVLASVFSKSKTVRLGAQTVSGASTQAHTGEVSAAMLKHFGVGVVIVGHSERRSQPGLGENDEAIRSQIRAAHTAGLTVVLCVGEVERDAMGAHFSVIEQQLLGALKDKTGGKLIVAYEPVWAIGKTSAEAMQPADLREMVIFIRKTLVDILGRVPGVRTPVLYGGSVDADNVPSLLAEGEVAGFLVGRASTEVDSFVTIIQAATKTLQKPAASRRSK